MVSTLLERCIFRLPAGRNTRNDDGMALKPAESSSPVLDEGSIPALPILGAQAGHVSATTPIDSPP